MSVNLQQTAIDPIGDVNEANRTAVVAMLKDTQGNILASHGRNNSHHLFVQFGPDADAVRAWFDTMATTQVTSAWAQFEGSAAHTANGTDAGAFVNLCLSATGYVALGGTTVTPDDASFNGGAKAAAPRLNDPAPGDWEPTFQSRIDALVIVADDQPDALAAAIAAIRSSLEGVGTIVGEETGAAMRLDDQGSVSTDKDARVHEHFGFADGVSQPLFFAKDVEASRLNSGGFDAWDPSAPLNLVLTPDPNGGPDGHGSYFVYRKLQQDVPSFRKDEATLAQTIFGTDTPTPDQAELAAAYIVGRFRDGTPVGEQAVKGWTNEPNNYNYDHDVDGTKCPFQSHARKTNPRGDKAAQFSIPLGQERSRRIVRRAVSYGPLTLEPAPEDKVGLLFLCAQSNIADQFEFMQAIWCNFDQFLRPDTGIDTVVGQAKPGGPVVPQKWPRDYGSANVLATPGITSPFVEYKFSEWVKMVGGEYFFVPSLSFLTASS